MAFVLPTEPEIRSIDTSQFVWDDLMDGTITMEQGAVLKSIADQMTPDQTILIKEQLAGTGKTARFILDNCDSSCKIITQDTFVNTFLYCDDFWENVGHNPLAYQNPQIPNELSYNEAGEIIGTTVIYPDGTTHFIDLTKDPEQRADHDLAAAKFDASYLTSKMVNYNGDKISETDDDFAVDFTAVFPFPISLGYELHERAGLLANLCTAFNRTKVGGVIAVFDIHYARVNEPLWQMYGIMKNSGKMYEAEYCLSHSPTGEGPWKGVVIKRTA